MHTNDKPGLIKSINNLIRHITNNQQSQDQIFASLERKDFQKIIANLTDPILQLRLTSARLIAELLYNSEILQYRFCQLLGIHFSNQSEIIINMNFDTIMRSYPNRAIEIIKLIKTHSKMRKDFDNKLNILLWFLNPQKEVLSIEYITQEQMKQLIRNYLKNENPQDVNFDPLFCIFGILIKSGNSQHLRNKSNQSTEITQVKQKVNDKGFPIFFEPYVLQSQIRQKKADSLNHDYARNQESYSKRQFQYDYRYRTQRREIYLPQQEVNLTDIKVKNRQNGITNNSCISQFKTYQMEQQDNFIEKQAQGMGNFSMVAPSLKVKTIAMGGRNVWENSKNGKVKLI